MQTLKTAAIVALLLTVIYGGYVSLTTPPEQVPPEVRDLLVIDDSFGIDNGVTGAMSDLQSTATNARSNVMNALESVSVNSQSGQNSFASSFPNSNGTAFSGPQMNSPTNGLQSQMASSSIDLPTFDEPAFGSPNGPSATLPRMGTQAKSASVNLNRDLPTAEGSFQFQGPNQSAPTSDITLPSLEQLPSGEQIPSIDQPQTKLTEQVSLSMDPNTNTVSATLADGATATENLGLANAFKTADRQYGADKVREALSTLSVFYNTPNIPDAQRQDLLSRLDPLAGEVIYSPRHLLEQPHRVGANETLMEIADNYRIPWQLLANVNGIQDPLVVTPGTELKVVRGPFSAQVDLNRKELTLMLGDLYAGRFPVAFGNNPAPRPGTFTVQDKQSQRIFNVGLGNPIPAGSPSNPYGKVWIDLGNQMCIHGSPETSTPNEQGCISLAGNYADDLFGILTQGSSVTIRR